MTALPLMHCHLFCIVLAPLLQLPVGMKLKPSLLALSAHLHGNSCDTCILTLLRICPRRVPRRGLTSPLLLLRPTSLSLVVSWMLISWLKEERTATSSCLSFSAVNPSTSS